MLSIAGILIIVLGIAAVVGIIALIVALCFKKDAPLPAGEGSYFDGNTFQLIGYSILAALLSAVTLGIAVPWIVCMVQGWQTRHTVINGRRLNFNGHGHQLIGKYLLWLFLTLITFGIYGIWLGLGMKKWVVKHTFYADEEQPVESYFSGGAGGYLGTYLLAALLTLVTFGIGAAWATKMILQWEAKHTHIGGSPLEFNGTGGQLFVKYLLLGLLTPLTLGIYALFFPVILLKWQAKHTEAVYKTKPIQEQARAHETPAMQDFAKYRIAANDQEIAAMKSGYTGKEDAAALERLAEEGNPFAAYRLAKFQKGDAALYEGNALELLQKGAEGKVHSALLDLAKQAPAEEKLSLLTEAAGFGNAEASGLLASEYKNAGDLPQAAYWSKVAMEWGVADAPSEEEYTALIKTIALNLSESRPSPKQSKALPIILGVVGVGVLAAILFVLMAVFGLTRFSAAKESATNLRVFYVDTVDVGEIEGQSFTANDINSMRVEYILDENVVLDRDNNTLYIQFGLENYEENVYLRCENGWRTQAIAPGTGITEVEYPDYMGTPYAIEIWAKYDETEGRFITSHYLNVTEESATDNNLGIIPPTQAAQASR